MKIPIAEIEISDRVRKSMGDIRSLAQSMDKVGLLQPVVLDKDFRLIAGMRRIEAAKLLNWDDITCIVATSVTSAAAYLIAERDENTCREPFTPSEAVEIGRRLEEIERPQAAARKASGVKPEPSGNLPEGSSAGNTRDIVGAAVGMSGRTYERAKTVVEAAEADPKKFGEIKKEMDATGKVTPAFDKVQEIKTGQPAKPKAPHAEREGGMGIICANEAINALRKIPKNDPLRKDGFKLVSKWIKDHP